MKIEPNESCSILLKDCWLTGITSRPVVGSPIYSIGDYQAIAFEPVLKTNRARLIVNNGSTETEYEINRSTLITCVHIIIGSIEKNPKEVASKKPRKYTARRIQVD